MTFHPFDAKLRSSMEEGMRAVYRIEDADGALRITTHCMYPSNGLVRVLLRGGGREMVASDDGEALGEALAAGIEIADVDKLLRSFVGSRGLHLKDGTIFSDPFPSEAAPIVIAHVANTAKEVALRLYEHGGVKRKRDFKGLLTAFLVESFRDRVSEEKLMGSSHKMHKFPNVIKFANGKKFIVDAASNDPSSINARLVANWDVRSLNDPCVEQRIVYDDAENWSSADLSLLQMGATIVPFSRSREVIRRVADVANESAVA